MNIKELSTLLNAMEKAGFSQRELNSERMRAIAQRLLAAHSAGAQAEPVAWQFRERGTGHWVACPEKPTHLSDRDFEKRPLYAQSQPITDAARNALFEDDHERREFANACDDFATCNETSVDYNLLMKWANSGLLECSHFEVTASGNAEIERIERED